MAVDALSFILALAAQNCSGDPRVDEILKLIPPQASQSNQLGDKNFINSSIATNTAFYISKTDEQGRKVPFESLEELQAYPIADLTNNDYAFVKGLDEHGYVAFYRYKYTKPLIGAGYWGLEYALNNSSFTAAQWEAINSGITTALVQQLITGGAGISEDIWDIPGISYVTDWLGNHPWVKAQLVTTSKTNPVSVAKRTRPSRPLKWGRNISSVKAFGNHTKRKRNVLWGQKIPAQPSSASNPIALTNLLNDANVVNAYDENGNYVYKGYIGTSDLSYKAYTASTKYRTIHAVLPAGTYTWWTDTADCHTLRYSIGSTLTSYSQDVNYYTFTLTEETEFQMCWRNSGSTEFSGEHSMIVAGSVVPPVYTPYNQPYKFVKNIGADGTGTEFGYFNEQTKDFVAVSGASGDLIQPVQYVSNASAATVVATALKAFDYDVFKIKARLKQDTSQSASFIGTNNGYWFGKVSDKWSVGGGVASADVTGDWQDVEVISTKSGTQIVQKITVDGVSATRTQVPAQQSTGNYRLFNVSDFAGIAMIGSSAEWEIYGDDVLIGHYIPVRIGTTVEYFDLVSGNIATRTGTLTAGADIPYIQLAPEDIVVPKGVLYVDDNGNITADGEHKVTVFEEGMNLFDKTAIKAGYYLGATGAEIANSIWNISDYMPVVGGATYYQYLTNGGTSPRTCWYNADKQFISAVEQKTRGTQTAPANARYCRMSIINQSTGTQDLDVAMFTIGSTAPASYVPYVAPEEIDIPMLLSDESFVEIQTGDRTEAWKAVSMNGVSAGRMVAGVYTSSGTKYCTINVGGSPGVNGGVGFIESNFFTPGGLAIGNCYVANAGATIVGVFADQSLDTVAKVNAYFAERYEAGDPIIFIYKLATPVTDTVEVDAIEPDDDSLALTIVGEAEISVAEQAKYIG